MKRVTLGLFVLAALLGLVELGVALAGIAPARRGSLVLWSPEIDRARLAPEGGYRFRAPTLWEHTTGWLEVDENGVRAPRGSGANDAAVRIACLGEERTFGARLLAVDTWPCRLETALRQMGFDVVVRSYAVVADSAELACARYLDRIRSWHPQVVVTYFNGRTESLPPPGGLGDAARVRMALEWDGLQPRTGERFAVVRWVQKWMHGWDDPLDCPAFDGRSVRVSPEGFGDALSRLASAVAADGGEVVLGVTAPSGPDGRSDPAAAHYGHVLVELARKRHYALAWLDANFAEASMRKLLQGNGTWTARAHELAARAAAAAIASLDSLQRAR